ncbi:MAG: hypothetical protein R3E79_26300 [Caldilineaceae bacterium]
MQRTITVTLVETLTLIWVYIPYDGEHDDGVTLEDATAAVLTPSSTVICSVSRATSTVHTTLWPAPTEEEQK